MPALWTNCVIVIMATLVAHSRKTSFVRNCSAISSWANPDSFLYEFFHSFAIVDFSSRNQIGVLLSLLSLHYEDPAFLWFPEEE
jgi:hypothetical protein